MKKPRDSRILLAWRKMKVGVVRKEKLGVWRGGGGEGMRRRARTKWIRGAQRTVDIYC